MRNEVAAHVDHQSAPGEARFVLNRDRWHGEAVGSGLHQLQKCFQPAHDSERRRCIKLRASGTDLKRIGFVFPEFLHGLAGTFTMNDQFGLSCIRNLHIERRHAHLASKIIKKACDRTLHEYIGRAPDSDRERGIN